MNNKERSGGAGPQAQSRVPEPVILPSHMHRSGEIDQSAVAQQPTMPEGDWEEKTVVDDSQLSKPKEDPGHALISTSGDDELTIDEPHKPPPAVPARAPAPRPGARGPSGAASPTRSASPAAPAGPFVGKLVVVAGNDRGKEFPLTGKPITVGRGIDNDVVLTDIAVSRKHLAIEFDGVRYKIIDKGSGNGTLINEQVETGNRVLRHGDRIEIGNTVFVLEHPASANADQGNTARAGAGNGPAAAGSTSGAPAPKLPPPGSLPPPPSPQASGAGEQRPRPQLPPPRRDGAGPTPGDQPGSRLPAPIPAALSQTIPGPGTAPVAAGQSASAVPSATPQGPPAIAPASASAAGSTQSPVPGPAPAFAAAQQPMSFPVTASPVQPGRTTNAASQLLPQSLVRTSVPSTRKTVIGVAATVVGITALAIVGLLLGDDPQLANPSNPAGAEQPRDAGPDAPGEASADEQPAVPAPEDAAAPDQGPSPASNAGVPPAGEQDKALPGSDGGTAGK